MPCWYTLLLRYNDQKFYLSPRASIVVVEDRDLETIQDSKGCGSCSGWKPDTWKVVANFKGSCSLESAWSLFRALEAFLEDACEVDSTTGQKPDLIIERTVCGETPLVYKITKTSLKMVDTLSQWGRPRVLKMEIVFSLVAWVEAGEGAVLVGA